MYNVVYTYYMEIFKDPIEFEWDKGNKDKNFKAHGVTNEECEEIFFDPHKRIVNKIFHQGREERYILIGATKERRILFIAFTIRRKKIRVISARGLSRKERKLYEESQNT